MISKRLKRKRIICNTIGWLLTLLVAYVGITLTIQRFKNPQLTDTELILLIPKNFMLEFE